MLHTLRDAQLGQARVGAHTPGSWTSTRVRRLELSRKLEGHDGEPQTSLEQVLGRQGLRSGEWGSVQQATRLGAPAQAA